MLESKRRGNMEYIGIPTNKDKTGRRKTEGEGTAHRKFQYVPEGQVSGFDVLGNRKRG